MKKTASAVLALIVFMGFSPLYAEDRPITIVALGDSTTAGTPFFQSPLETPPDGEGDPQGQYAYWIMHQHPQWKVLNYGIKGETSDQIHLRMNDALAAAPRYIIILAGANDIYQGFPLQQLSRNLLLMYREAKAHSVMPIAVTVLPFDTANAHQRKQIRELNAWIKTASDKENIPFADLFSAVEDPKNPDHLNGSPDGIHPDIGGYRKMGLILSKVIEHMEANRPR